ncbi:hydrogen voltage-gated channel 1 [Ophiostoma piceae UAMH 11346]|uniref:Hydrogen voltage-gated channel 1 n=1 Tax=Ophiostoma piceae (strain UAMH 11346) TaxID=1262450 RepID=S3C656_OPHP1|nr:hydrogen voltage-gated channel 1 [Ophiostoma piceae UAMH 11346]
MAGSSVPLLHNPSGASPPAGGYTARGTHWSSHSQRYLESKQKHYLLLGLVGLDAVAILTEILVFLVTCETGTQGEPWAETVLETTKLSGLVISSLFLAELLPSIWAVGWDFFGTWCHCFYAFVILASFAVDVLAHGVLDDIASLVVILRLWRMAKIVEEVSVGAEEQVEELEARVEKLEHEKVVLGQQLRALEEAQEAGA